MAQERYTLANMQDMGLNSIFNLQPVGTYTYRAFSSSPDASKERIYSNYVQLYEKDFMNKAGKKPEDFMKDVQLYNRSVGSITEFLKSFNSIKKEFSQNTTAINRFVSQAIKGDNTVLENLNRQKPEVLQAISNWEKSTEAYLNLLANLSDGQYLREMGGDPTGKLPAIGSLQPSEAFKLNMSSLAALDTADRTFAQLKQATDKLKNSSDIASDLGKVAVSRATSRGIKDGNLTQTISSITGAISNVFGFAFENELANGLASQIGQGIQDVSILGASKNVELTMNGAPISVSQGKTDVRATVEGVSIGLSLKNVGRNKSGGGSSVSLNSSSLTPILQLVANNMETRSQIAATIVANTARKKSYLPMFLAALTADYAVAMGGQDRVDFMVFNNKIYPLGQYYEILKKRLTLDIQSATKAQIKSIRGADNGQIMSVAESLSTSYKD